MPDRDKYFYHLLSVLEEQEENLWSAIEKNHDAQRRVKALYNAENPGDVKRQELLEKAFGEKNAP